MKSKMPWVPGLAPLMKVDQATGLCGGMLVRRGEKWPVRDSFAKFGSSPAFM